MKKIAFIISILSLLMVSCEKDATASDFLDGNQIEKLKIISRGIKDPVTGELTDPITGGIINPTTGVITDPATGLEIDPVTGVVIDPTGGGTPSPDKIFAEAGDFIGLIDDEEFIVRSFSATLDGALLTINLIDIEGNSIIMSVNNPMTQPFAVGAAQDFVGNINKAGAIFSTGFSSSATGFLQLIYDGNTVSGSFTFKAFTETGSESSEITGGNFDNIQVVEL